MRAEARPLRNGTVLRGYRLVKLLSRGGFSLVYGAVRVADRCPVVVKEYYPVSLAEREASGRVVPRPGERNARLFDYARRLFFQESALLAALEHPHIVPVLDFFHAFGTVYSVMAYQPGVTLQAVLRHRRGGLPERGILRVFGPICEGLGLLHDNGLVHLDVKPGNVYLRRRGGPMLLDFGAACKAAPLVEGMMPVVSEGYSPPEQLTRGATVGPWSDLYAVAASMRACMSGRPPLSSRRRRQGEYLEPATEAFAGRYSRRLLEAVDWAMDMDPEARPQSVAEFMAAWPEDWQREVA